MVISAEAIRTSIDFVLFKKEDPDFEIDSSLEKKINSLIKRVEKALLSDKSLEEIAKQLSPSMFEVRVLALKSMYNKSNGLSQFAALIHEDVAQRYLAFKYQNLSHTIADALRNYQRIIDPILSIENVDQILGPALENAPAKINSKTLTAMGVPHEIKKYLMQWYKASLSFELCLVFSDVIIAEHIVVKKKRVDQVAQFATDQIQKFGAFAILSRVWQPSDADYSNDILGMKILASAYELKYGRGKEIKLSSLKA